MQHITKPQNTKVAFSLTAQNAVVASTSEGYPEAGALSVVVQENRGVVALAFLLGIAILQEDLAVIEQGLGHGAGDALVLSRKEAVFFPEIKIA